jgi:ankyrin repeat protein
VTRHRRRVALFSLLLLTSIIVAVGLWLRTQRHQDALNGQLIAALVKHDAQKALSLVNSGADPNTPCHPVPPPSLRQLWNYLLHRAPLPTTDSPTALLIACGADSTADDGTPNLWINVDRTENSQLVETMFQHGGNFNARDQDKQTPLMWAAFARYPKTVGVLLERKASVNAQDAFGCTALYRAVEVTAPRDLAGTDIIRQLLANGANPNVATNAGFTPVQFAQYHHRPDLVALLRQSGAKK